jgi:beta-phosphoglucomutase
MNSLGVIFDMDGVLIDTFQTHLGAWQEVAADYGLTVDADAFRPLFGRKGKTILQVLWPHHFNDEQGTIFDDRKQAAFRARLAKHFPEMDGAGELIKSLHDAGFRLAIGSSGSPENVAMVKSLITHGDLIDATVSANDVTEGKPNPQVFQVAAKRLGLDPGQTAVIEDALPGLEAARRAGAAAVAKTGTESPEALASHADLVVQSLRELSPEKLAAVIQRHGKTTGIPLHPPSTAAAIASISA